METITIEVKPYMAAYLYVRYGQCVEPFGYDCPLPQPVRLPHGGKLYRTLYNETLPQPGKLRKEAGNITFVLPHPHAGKNPCTYNYLGRKGVNELQKAVRVQIKMELFDFMVEQKYNEGHTYKYSIRKFLQKYGMEDLVSEESMLRLFYAWRRKQKMAQHEEEL
ncbi:hypothetical protein [Bacteroides sp.]